MEKRLAHGPSESSSNLLFVFHLGSQTDGYFFQRVFFAGDNAPGVMSIVLPGSNLIPNLKGFAHSDIEHVLLCKLDCSPLTSEPVKAPGKFIFVQSSTTWVL